MQQTAILFSGMKSVKKHSPLASTATGLSKSSGYLAVYENCGSPPAELNLESWEAVFRSNS